MKIEFYGHSSFLITLENETEILFDPFRNMPAEWNLNWFIKPFPALSPDLVVVTHPHFDHDGVDTLNNLPTILRDPIDVNGRGFKILAKQDKHAKDYGAEFGGWNNIVVLEADGIRFCHWGDNRPDPAMEIFDWLGEVDVLTLPIDDQEHILEFAEAEQLLNQARPKIVLPVHYKIDGVHHDDASLGGIDRWLSTKHSVKQLAGSQVKLESDQLPSTTEVWVFEEVAE